MKIIGTVVMNLSVVLLGASTAMAGSLSSMAAKQDLQTLEKFKDSAVSKGILKRHCKSMPEISELCKGPASELSGANLSEVKEAVVADLEKEAVKEEVKEEPAPQQASVTNVSSVSNSNSSVNVSSGDGNQSSNSTVAAYPGADCVNQVNKNMQNFVSSFNTRMSNFNARSNKN